MPFEKGCGGRGRRRGRGRGRGRGMTLMMSRSLLSLRGMIVFVTQTLAESLTDNGTGQRRRPSCTPEEVSFFRAIQEELSSSQKRPHSLLRTFAWSRSGVKASCAGLQRQSVSPLSLEPDYHLVDLERIYTEVGTFFNHAREWWEENTREWELLKGASVSACPEIIMIVLSPVGTTAMMEPGNMIPSFVRAPMDDTNEEEEGCCSVRLCGFPSSVKLSISLDQLQQLSPGYPNQASLPGGGNWLMVHPWSHVVSHDWCSSILISSDFITHSLFFLEWCVVEDFVWSSTRKASEGWGCDVLGKLLRSICGHLDFNIDTDGDKGTPLKHRRTEKEEEGEEAFSDVLPTEGMDGIGSMQALEELKRDVDIGFVETVSNTISAPRQECVAKALLGHLDMIEEIYSSNVLHPCDLSTRDEGNTVSSLLYSGAPLGRVAELLKEWEDIQKGQCASPPSSSSYSFCTNPPFHGPRDDDDAADVGLPNEPAVASFMEMMQQRFSVFHPRQRSVPFLLTRDGEKLLKAPCVANTTLREPCDNMVELADVAELSAILNETTDFAFTGTAGDDVVGCRLPQGQLANIMEASAASFISSAMSHETTTSTTAAVDNEDMSDEYSGEKNRDCHPGGSDTNFLEMLVDVFLNQMNSSEKERGGGDNQLHDALKEMIKELSGIRLNEAGSAAENITDTADELLGVPTTTTATTTVGRVGMLQKAVKGAACSLTEMEAQTRGARWLSHIAFLLSHASAPNVVTSSRANLSAAAITKITEEDRARRVLRGMEAHLYFLDAALCALDEVIEKRWSQAHEALQKSTA